MHSATNKNAASKMRIACDKVFIGVAALLAVSALGIWSRMHFYGLGINDVLSREYVFQDDRELGEDVAIEVTRSALQRYGRDVSAMAPHSGLVTGNSKSRGRVTWGPTDREQPWEFLVRIDKIDNVFHCRVYRAK